MPEQIAITKRNGVPGMLKVLPVITLIILFLLFSVSPCLANEGQAGTPSHDTSGYNMNFGWKDGGPTTPVESPPENQTPAQHPPAQTTDPQPAPQPTPTQPTPQPVQQPAPQPEPTESGEGVNQQGPTVPDPGDDLNFEWSDQEDTPGSLPQDPEIMLSPPGSAHG